MAKNYEKIMSMEQEIMMHGGEELDGADPSVFGAERKGKEQRWFVAFCVYVLLVGMEMVVFSVYASETEFYAMLL